MEAIGGSDILDMFINISEGVLRIIHELDISDVRSPLVDRLTLLGDWPKESWSSLISLNEAEKELKIDARAYLYFAKKFEGDPDEDLSFARGYQVDFCSTMNPKGGPIDEREFGEDPKGDFSSARDYRVDLCSMMINPKEDLVKKGEIPL